MCELTNEYLIERGAQVHLKSFCKNKIKIKVFSVFKLYSIAL